MTHLFLTLSIIFNIVFVWYIIQLLKRFLTFQEELDNFSVTLEEYRDHIDIVNGLERFYGDETLGNLLRHSKALVEECQSFQRVLRQEEKNMPRKRTKNHYFRKEHQDAIVEYCQTQDPKRRNELYKDLLVQYLMKWLTRLFIRTSSPLFPISILSKDDCKNWLITVLYNFDPEKGSKAFTYFSVVSKNWFIAEVKKTSKKAKRETHLEEYFLTHSDQANTTTIQQLVVHNTYIEDRNKHEFFLHLNKEIQGWKKMPLRENEVKTIQAIEILFNEANNIEIFNKKAIYLYIREITGLNTKQVVSSLNKIRKRYRDFKKEWDDQ